MSASGAGSRFHYAFWTAHGRVAIGEEILPVIPVGVCRPSIRAECGARVHRTG